MENKKRKTIGILGGMGAGATVDLYMEIWKYYQTNFGAKYDNDFPPIIIYSVPIPDVVESVENEKLTLEMLQATAQTLEKGGVDFIVIACNTVQFLLDKIRQVVSIPVIGIAEVNAEYLQGKGISKAGILATVIPPFIVAIAAIVFQLVHNAAGKTWVSDISNVCFIAGLGLIGAAILASAGLAFSHKGEVAKGIGFGVCIAVIVSIIEFGLLEWLGGV